MAKKEKPQQTFYGNLTFKQFRNVGKNGVELSDIAWAGRLFTKYPRIWATTTRLVAVFCSITILSLAVIWLSIFTRPPALLLAVYPNSQVVCFPRLIDNQGKRVQVNKSYQQLCQNLDIRSGKMWQTENRMSQSDNSAVGNFKPSVSTAPTSQVQYIKISDVPEFNFTDSPEAVDPTIPGSGGL